MEDLTSVFGVIGVFGVPLALIGLGALRMFLKHQAEMFGRKLLAQSQANSQTQAEVAALRSELAQLRDTSTQYDISIEHSLGELQHRMAHVEDRSRPVIEPAASEAPAQVVRS